AETKGGRASSSGLHTPPGPESEHHEEVRASSSAVSSSAVARELSFDSAGAGKDKAKIHDITATVGPLGLGLMLGEEKEG
ncbi:unnamed protein product, partial [Ectocarpus sp. 12 AP-2014]